MGRIFSVAKELLGNWVAENKPSARLRAATHAMTGEAPMPSDMSHEEFKGHMEDLLNGVDGITFNEHMPNILGRLHPEVQDKAGGGPIRGSRITLPGSFRR